MYVLFSVQYSFEVGVFLIISVAHCVLRGLWLLWRYITDCHNLYLYSHTLGVCELGPHYFCAPFLFLRSSFIILSPFSCHLNRPQFSCHNSILFLQSSQCSCHNSPTTILLTQFSCHNSPATILLTQISRHDCACRDLSCSFTWLV